jgi:geranylgeranyl reductase family protein
VRRQDNQKPQVDARLPRQIWDVAVVGAGPAGSTAAIHLASLGHRVLLLDKEDFPRDKVCGDGLIADAIRCLSRVGLYEEVRRLGFATATGSVFSPSRVQFDVPGEFLTLKRIVLDNLIARKAVEQGAWLARARVKEVNPLADRTVALEIEGRGETVVAKVALLATGANVELSGKLGLLTQAGPSAVALRCYVRSRFSVDRLVISYDRSITPGYAWIFPVGNGEYNVGCGVRYDGNSGARPNLKQALSEFLNSFPLAVDLMKEAVSVTPVRGAMLRCGLGGARATGPGNILAIGEMIGTTFPFTGEGIGKAMETGELAAEITHQALTTGDFDLLGEFPRRVERELRPKFLGYQIAEDWLSRPWLNDLVARRIRRSRYLLDSVTGIVNETVDPREVFSVRGLLRSLFR